MTFPTGTKFTWVADITERDGEIYCVSFSGHARAEAVKAAGEYCEPLSRRTLHQVCDDWESAVVPEAYPGQPLTDRIVAWRDRHSIQVEAAE